MADESMESVLERAVRLHQETMEKHAERIGRLDRSHADHEARLAHYDQLHAEHQAHMARLDRQYDKLLEIAADIAATNDRLEDQLMQHGHTQREQASTQRDIRRLITETRAQIAQNAVRITQNEEMLRQLIEMQRRRNGGQTP